MKNRIGGGDLTLKSKIIFHRRFWRQKMPRAQQARQGGEMVIKLVDDCKTRAGSKLRCHSIRYRPISACRQNRLPVFLHDRIRYDKFKFAIMPCTQHIERHSTEKYGGHDNVRIKHGAHQALPFALAVRFSACTSRMAAVMSLGRMPAAFAAARDSLASSLNKSRGGSTIACSITAFPLATTVKVVPSPNPHSMRIGSGITTCPREDILVVGTETM